MADDDGWALPGSVWMEGDSLAPPCGSEPLVVRRIVEVAQLSSSDVLVDLGCGDARICIAAAESSGCRAIGVEVEANLVAEAQAAIDAKGLNDLVQVLHGDLLSFDLAAAGATVVVVYLLPAAVETIRPQLLRCMADQGARVLTQLWGLSGATPAAVVEEWTDGVSVSLCLYRHSSVSSGRASGGDGGDGSDGGGDSACASGNGGRTDDCAHAGGGNSTPGVSASTDRAAGGSDSDMSAAPGAEPSVRIG